MIDEKKLLQKIKEKDKEIAELKQLLAEAEQEIKELNDFRGFQKPRPGILESQLLNKLIKRTALLLIAAAIIFLGVYPWVFKDKLFSSSQKQNQEVVNQEQTNSASQDNNVIADNNAQPAVATTTVDSQSTPQVPASDSTAANRDIFKPAQTLVVKSDLGWLNVRTQPSQEGDVIKKINSGENYEWLEKTDNNWYKIKLDDAGHTGYVSGEYVEIKQ